ncbi:MAG: cytochrome c3 family protein [Desulfobacterales bacterium]
MYLKKRNLLIIMFFVAIFLLFAGGLNAGTKVKDKIKMDNPAYEKHKKGINIFTHKKHATVYQENNPDLFKNGCGECHHDDDNEPLKDLKEGDEVQNCIECHQEPAYMRGKEARGLSKEEKLEYHANAIHYNCRGCHKLYNKKMNLRSKDKGAAPRRCKQCHPD